MAVHDPMWLRIPECPSSPLSKKSVEGADAIVIFAATPSTGTWMRPYLKNLSGRKHPMIVDGRNLVDPDAYIRDGFIYKGIGRGDKNGHAIVEQ